MGCDCCGPPASAAESVTAETPPPSDVGSCKDACCDGGDAGTEVEEKESANKERDDDCCASGSCEEPNKDDAPECCRGKISPCCNASCIDRIAIRECELSASHKRKFQRLKITTNGQFLTLCSGCNGLRQL